MVSTRETIVVLDLASPDSRLIARKVREAGVYSEIHPYNVHLERLKGMLIKGIILSGRADDKSNLKCNPDLLNLGVPVLGIGSGIEELYPEEDGQVCFKTRAEGRLIFEIDQERRFYGQSHPTFQIPEDVAVLKEFLFTICKCEASWTPQLFIKEQVDKVRKIVGKQKVLCALSGGVDSSVAAVLINRAIGDQLTCVFVDNGLLRKNEARQVASVFRKKFNLRLIEVDAANRFLDKLKGVVDPEEKRKIIGHEFIRVFEEEAKKLGEIDYLVQGTLYPDVIESVSAQGTTVKVKSHHNVGGLPPDLQFKLLEPFRTLFKDEVRAIGEELGLPEEIVWRHPFPGPGLAVRVIGGITKERLDILREADHIMIEEIKKSGYYQKLWQAFAVLTDTKSVGMREEKRTYDHVVALRAVTSEDAMTAQWARLPHDLLARISQRIIDEIPGINRVVYDITSKPPGTIEWE